MSNEEALRDIILEHIGDERFCDDCPAIEYDNSTGTLDCPYYYDWKTHDVTEIPNGAILRVG